MTGIRSLTIFLEVATVVDVVVFVGVAVQYAIRVQLVDFLQRLIHLGRGGVWERGADVAG